MGESDDTYYFDRYGDLELQRRMVSDRVRTRAFAAAIREVVKPGMRVLDAGCGTGILGMLAARAGAEEVVAIDNSSIAQTAANLVKHNGLEGTVRVLRGPVAELASDEPFDVIVSEWLGNFGLVEDMWPDICAARDQLLAPGGRMLPETVELRLAPVDDGVGYHGDGPGYWQRPVEGLDFAELEALELRQGRAVQVRIDGASLMGPGHRLATIDCHRDGPDAGQGFAELDVQFERSGRLVGFVGWFDAQLSPGVRLTTAPGEPETHWAQTFLPFTPMSVEAGHRQAMEVELGLHPTERRHLQLGVRMGSEHLFFRLE